MTRWCGGVVALLVGLSASWQARADLVINGSFESPDVNATTTDGRAYYIYTRTGTSLSGWTIVGSQLVILDSRPPYWVAAEGNQYIELESGFGSAIEQTLSTVAGTEYTIRFAYAPNPDRYSTSPSDRSLNVSWDGALVANVTASDPTVEDLNWQYFQYNITAAGSSTVLRFEDGGNGVPYTGAFLDAVSVTSAAVPEPSSLALACIGALSLGWRCRRSRRAA